MAGIYPAGGVTAANTQNGVDVVSTCAADELFYPIGVCQPRFNPAAMNALISEVLNFVTELGVAYDCSKLTNMADAIGNIGGIQNAIAGGTINEGSIVRSTDGYLLYNCTTAVIVAPASAASITYDGLVTLGLCPITQPLAELRDLANNLTGYIIAP